MKPDNFLGGRVTLYGGDCLAALPLLADNSIDSCVVDPPYHLASIVKRFAKTGGGDRTASRVGAYTRHACGFMGRTWDGGDIAFRPETWAAVLRVLKPGAHLVAFAAPKNGHRLACAIEDAGFEIRDTIAWLFGSGFQKSHDVSKGIDRIAGAEREIVTVGAPVKRMIPGADQNASGWEKNNGREYVPNRSAPATEAAAEWKGWGTALKPAYEPIILARKPLSEKTVAANVLRWRTGALNIEACRVAGNEDTARAQGKDICGGNWSGNGGQSELTTGGGTGRWPANVTHDGSDEVIESFPDAPGQQYYVGPEHGERLSRGIYGDFGARPPNEPRGDSGSAARFFYSAKADANDRIGSKHPTVKPIDLMQWLVRLVTPPRGTVLDPFAGTGSTAEAAWREGMNCVLIEREKEYQADIQRRMKLCLAGPDERARESIKAKTKDDPVDHGPLFAT